MVEKTKNEKSCSYRSKISLSQSTFFWVQTFLARTKKKIQIVESLFFGQTQNCYERSKIFGPIGGHGRKPMIAWKPMVVYGGPNYLHRPWGSTKPNTWGRTNPVAWGPPQLTNIETSGFDAPNVLDYLDDYEQGNSLKGYDNWSCAARCSLTV